MDHSHMDHSQMVHGDMDHGGGHPGGGGMPMCNMNMLFTWDTTNLCIVFRQWHVTGRVSLVFSLLAIMAICAGYEALREATRRYELWLSNKEAAYNRNQDNDHQDHERGQEQVAETTPFLGIERIGTGAGAGSPPDSPVGQRARILKAVLYGVQNFYAFMIMLLFMTYNGYVMIAVAIGAGLGYYFFGSNTRATKETACH
ncbi:putative CTR2 short splice [Rosellinia necatrix]|uniref:Copper transport protein n=1 Tax=Rosellinia necatrix TaxID=77044 RepID=A0A1S7ULS4_ROSNE|nr:putative CTR2 short splice [Rosellinia necatrix]